MEYKLMNNNAGPQREIQKKEHGPRAQFVPFSLICQNTFIHHMIDPVNATIENHKYTQWTYYLSTMSGNKKLSCFGAEFCHESHPISPRESSKRAAA